MAEVKFNTIALVGAIIAVFGLTFIVVADRMYESAENDYLASITTWEEYVDQVDSIDAIWTIGTVLIAVAVIFVAVSVPKISASSIETMKRNIEADFYRKCPSCGSWNTKFANNCSTCGILLPKLPEMSVVKPEPSVFKEGPQDKN